MRTTRPRPTSSLRTLGLLSALTALSVALAGCPDALRLDPGPDGGSGGAEADGGVMRCDSNPDCVAPKAVCDAVQRQCVECLTVGDCAAKPGTVCSAGQCACENPAESSCPRAGEGQPARCVDVKTAPTDCGACGHSCFGACVEGACLGGWEVTSLFGAPAARSQHVAVWDEADGLMVVWGGVASPSNQLTATGGLYDLAKNRWAATSLLEAPSARQGATAVWASAAHVMIVWGGQDAAGAFLNTGALFDPKANTWTPMSTEGAPSPRSGHTAVWDDANEVMIVWGGTNAMQRFADGDIFDPKKNVWAPLPAAPLGSRVRHTAVWIGGSMSIWGGFGLDDGAPPLPPPPEGFLASGADYNPQAGWGPILSNSPLSPRQQHTAVSTGKAALIWGGFDGAKRLGDGAKYDGTTWSALSPEAALDARNLHAAVWIPATGEMIIWGGQGAGGLLNSGARFVDASNTWKPMPTALSARARPTAVVGGAKVIFWGGDTAEGPTNTGGIFEASAK